LHFFRPARTEIAMLEPFAFMYRASAAYTSILFRYAFALASEAISNLLAAFLPARTSFADAFFLMFNHLSQPQLVV